MTPPTPNAVPSPSRIFLGPWGPHLHRGGLQLPKGCPVPICPCLWREKGGRLGAVGAGAGGGQANPLLLFLPSFQAAAGKPLFFQSGHLRNAQDSRDEEKPGHVVYTFTANCRIPFSQMPKYTWQDLLQEVMGPEAQGGPSGPERLGPATLDVRGVRGHQGGHSTASPGSRWKGSPLPLGPSPHAILGSLCTTPGLVGVS